MASLHSGTSVFIVLRVVMYIQPALLRVVAPPWLVTLDQAGEASEALGTRLVLNRQATIPRCFIDLCFGRNIVRMTLPGRIGACTPAICQLCGLMPLTAL